MTAHGDWGRARLTRRACLVGLPLVGACSRREAPPTPALTATANVPSAQTDATSSERAAPLHAAASADSASRPTPLVQRMEWDFGSRGRVVVLLARADESVRVPVVVALHGRGEALKGPVRGPDGWPRDYALARAMGRVFAPPLATSDFEGLITGERLRSINARLVERPFRGLAVLSPFLPDFDWNAPSDELVRSYARFLLDEVVARARRELPVLGTPSATGIDGVSLGGAMALRVGLRYPKEFGAVGTLQCALQPGFAGALAREAFRARRENPALALRVATSVDDSFKESNRALSDAFTAPGVTHTFADHLGPHDYVWNRGPGSYELLLFHDASLRP